MEPPRTRHELENLFALCFGAAVSGASPASIEVFEALCQGVSLQSIFSKNEEFDDVDTADVGLALADFWLACEVMKLPSPLPLNPVLRQNRLLTSRALFERFLLRCAQFGIYLEKKKWVETLPSRDDKIERFRRLKEAKMALSSTDDVRNKWRLRLDIACLESLDDLDGITRELEVLAFMVEREGAAMPVAQEEPIKKPIEVTKIGPNFTMQRETFQNGVFKPYHRLPTVSLEEYADQEMQKIRDEETRKKDTAEVKPVQSLDELGEEGLEDDDWLFDAAIAKARKWDDWKDGVPKGSGVTKRF